jgi:hypothetical protein
MFDVNHKPHDSADAFRLLVSPYHPDTLRYPAPGPVVRATDRLRHALTWNVFKTLEQIAPGVWMRPLIARCAGLPEGYNSAPHVAAVTCWSDLKPAPSAMLRRGRRNGVPVDVVIETDDTLVAVLTPSQQDLLARVVSDTADDGLLDLAEATACLAGTRSAYVTVVLPVAADEEVWSARVRRRAERVLRVLNASGRTASNIRGIGVTTWAALHELLCDTSASRFIPVNEQRIAATTAGWMGERLGTDLDRQLLA